MSWYWTPPRLNPTRFIHSSACLSWGQSMLQTAYHVCGNRYNRRNPRLTSNCVYLLQHTKVGQRDAILQTLLSYSPLHFFNGNDCILIKVSLNPTRVQSTINHHWFRWRLGTVQITNIVWIIDILKYICLGVLDEFNSTHPHWIPSIVSGPGPSSSR